MRLAIVTGGSKGLGLALCEALIDAGYRVVEFSRTAPHPYSTRVDLSRPLESRHAVEDALKSLSTPEVVELLVFNNAATLDPLGATSVKSPEALIANLNVNLVSSVALLSAIVAEFQETRGRKVLANISSGAAEKAYAGASLYCAAKAGMEHFVRSFALEQQRKPAPFVAINIWPGVIDTDMQAQLAEASTEDFPESGRFARRRNAGGLASSREVADTALRICHSSSIVAGGRYDVEQWKS